MKTSELQSQLDAENLNFLNYILNSSLKNSHA